MLSNFLLAIYFFFPAGIANTVPVIIAKVPILRDIKYPVDFGAQFRGRRLLGKNKTIRGFVFGIACAILFVQFEIHLYENVNWINENIDLNYSEINPLILGPLLGAGSLVGDAVKSFFKRQFDRKPGSAWFPFDQIDYVIGGILFTIPYIQLNLATYFIIIVFWFLMHPITTVIAYFIKLKDQPI